MQKFVGAMRPGTIDNINHQAINFFDSQFSGLKRGIHHSVEETTCVF